MTDSVATALADLTAADMTEMLSSEHTPPFKVVSVTAEALPVQGGVCDLARLTLAYDPPNAAGPASVVAKIPKADPGVRAASAAVGLYERERLFYAQLAQAVPLRVPGCFYPGDGDAAQRPLLLEDLTAMTAGDQVAGFTLEQTQALVDSLAELHATYWGDPRLDGPEFEWLLTPSHPEFSAGLEGVVAASLDPFLARYTGRLPADALDEVTARAADFPNILAACAAGPHTLIHFDTRADNWMFGPDGAPCLSDWQTCARMRGVHDVAYLITGSVDADIQSANWQELLRRYHTALTRHGVTDYSWDDCLAQYREHVTCAMLLMLVMIGTVAIKSERGEALADAILGRAVRHALEVGNR